VRIETLLETTGLDWLPYVVSGRDPPLSAGSDNPNSCETLRSYSGEALQELIGACQALFDETEDRIQRIEAKASSLMGFTGVGLALSANLAANLLDPKRVLPSLARPVLAVLFAAVALSFLSALLLLMRVLAVHRYRHTALSLGTGATVADMRQERAESLCRAQTSNDAVARAKATLLGGGQLWFRNAVIALVPLSLGYFLPAGVAPSPVSAASTVSTGRPQTAPQPTTLVGTAPVVAPTLVPSQPPPSPTPAPQPQPTVTATPPRSTSTPRAAPSAARPRRTP
jgi:hypothetical protein